MEHLLFIIQYSIKKYMISVFDDLRHRIIGPSCSPTLPPRLKSPSIRFLSSAIVKPHQAGEAYVNLATTTALNIIWRFSVDSPWLRSILSACTDCTQLHVTSRTMSCALTDKWFVTVTTSIFIDVTRWMSVSGGGRQTTPSSTFRKYDFQNKQTFIGCWQP